MTEDEENGLHVELVDEQPSKPKKKKKSKEDKTLELENPPSPVPLYEAPVVEKRKKKAVKNLSPEGKQEAPVPLNGERDDSVSKEPSEEESVVKRKRRRRRRKSHHKSESFLQDTSLALQQVEVVQQQQYYVATTPAPRERQHVRFGDDDISDLDTEPEFNLKTQVVQTTTTNVSSGGFKKPESNGIDKFDGSSNVGEVRVKGSKTQANKPATVYHQGPSAASSPVLPQLGALLSLRSAVFSRNSNDKVITNTTPSYNNVPPPPTLANGRGKPVPSSPQIAASTAGEPTKIDPTAFPIITGPPRLNDLIAFKVSSSQHVDCFYSDNFFIFNHCTYCVLRYWNYRRITIPKSQTTCRVESFKRIRMASSPSSYWVGTHRTLFPFPRLQSHQQVF